jgi:hypothetical protein
LQGFELLLVSFSASSLKRSAARPFGVSVATTWLNLMTMGAWAHAAALSDAPASSASAATTDLIFMMSPLQL